MVERPQDETLRGDAGNEPQIVFPSGEQCPADRLVVPPEDALEVCRSGHGSREVVDVDGADRRPDLVGAQGERRPEVAEEAVIGFGGHLPDAEETQYVIDAVHVDVLGERREAIPPPPIAVLGHAVPVVGRELPVLAAHGERIGWGARLRTHVEQLGLRPHLDALRGDADG